MRNPIHSCNKFLNGLLILINVFIVFKTYLLYNSRDDLFKNPSTSNYCQQRFNDITFVLSPSTGSLHSVGDDSCQHLPILYSS